MNILAVVISTLAALLLFSSGANWLLETGKVDIFTTLQSWVANLLLGISALLIAVQVALTRHPFYEYWIISALGLIIGAVYVI